MCHSRTHTDILAKHHVVGLEITEYEATWPDGRSNRAQERIRAIQPVMEVLGLRSQRVRPVLTR